jgi:long-subunit acyl-CoA synthetase (AMP-forming)
VIKLGKESKEEYKFQEPEPNNVYMFCYTSGTTGDPKAV